MTNTVYTAAYISEPPVSHPFYESSGQMSSAWINWFNSITQSFGFCVVHDVLAEDAPVLKREAVAVVKVPEFTTEQRNTLQNARNGTIIYNSKTNEFNFVQGGNWVKFTAVPA